MDEDQFQSIPVVAQALGLTDRRLRQFVEAGEIPRLERGKISLSWALYLYLGRNWTKAWNRKPSSADAAVAYGWARAMELESPGGAERQKSVLIDLFEKVGRTRDDALLALGEALGYLSHARMRTDAASLDSVRL